MASTMLSDVVIPVVYNSYTAVDSPELTAFFQSGAVTRNAMLDTIATAGGTIAHLPFWKDLDATIEPNYSTDNPSDVATPQKITAGEMITRISNLNQGYSAADLVAELAGSNPMQRIRNRFGTYWMRQWQRRVLAAARGVLASNVANNGSDMVSNLALETGTGVTSANLFSRSAFTGALFSLGDHFGEISVIAVHSVVFKTMVDADDIQFITPSTPDPNLPLNNQAVPYFLGKRIIVDDNMPVVAGTTDGYKYYSILFGTGAFGYGEGNPLIPTEIYRRPDQGNGGGVEQLWERKTWILHPFGYQFTSSSVAGQSPTLAELATAANWSRVVDRKNVPLAFLVTNG